MDSVSIINITIDLVFLAFDLTFILMLLIIKERQTDLDKVFIALLIIGTAIFAFDPITWWLDGKPGDFVGPVLYICNSLVYILGYACGVAFTFYVMSYLSLYARPVSKKIPVVLAVYFAAMTIITLTTPFTGFIFSVDDTNVIHLGPLDILVYFCSAAVALFNLYLVLKNHAYLERQTLLILGICATIPAVFTCIELFAEGILLSYAAVAISGIVLYMSLYLQHSIERVKRENAMKTSLMLSQIQPHFLINSLLAIKALTRSDPEEAGETIDDFAYYLRSNMNALASEELLPLEDELMHTRAYLALEEKRFGDRVHVVEDIHTTAMRLPALTLQPLVENAIKHGITKKEDGGTVTIRTREDEKCWVLVVEDNGTGFDTATLDAAEAPKIQPDDLRPQARTSVGLRNVSARIAAQCQGILSAESDPSGTRITVTIPKLHE